VICVARSRRRRNRLRCVVPLPGALFPVVVKKAVDQLGLDAGPARQPVGRMQEDARKHLIQVLRDMGVL
jgi:hypothetical protein